MHASCAGFPEFEQFYVSVSFRRTQLLKSDASTIPPRPHFLPYIQRGPGGQGKIGGVVVT